MTRGGIESTPERSRSGRPVGSVESRSPREREIRARLREWILEHAKAPPPGGGLSDQTGLLDTGLLSSLDVVEFVLFIEELRGAEVEADEIEPEVFTNLDTLWDGFFADVV
jgi:acyl carrier protein